MAELLIIADDLTGALDTGVRFAAAGSSVRVFTGSAPDAFSSAGVRVPVADTESRHLPPREAYGAVYRAASEAAAAGIPYIYKKTDSALRGNVGSELAAVMDALGDDRLVFAPAFPGFGRTTRNGVHYVGGVPVAESVFGADPFEPVRSSAVEDILRAQMEKPIVVHTDSRQAPEGPGVHVYDAQTDEDLKAAAQSAAAAGIRLFAGCAAFASALAEWMRPEQAAGKLCFSGPLLVLCGSRNPVTIRQLEAAEAAGYPRVRLSPGQVLRWKNGDAGLRQAGEWTQMAEECGLGMVDVTGPEEGGLPSRAELRESIAAGLGRIGQAILDAGMRGALLCTGGDTLLAVMEAAGIRGLAPAGELAPGVVLSHTEYGGNDHIIISKSGGFGVPDLFCALAQGKRSGTDGE